ncbi:MAG: hypothetical protein HYZ51_04055 [Candidatus Doudnabacteria bacterium]|nr:hypothetical protein [Candidatus Doudnabacteria bacterium]
MHNDRWQQLTEIARKNFKRANLHTEDLIMETQDGPIKQGTKDILEFDHPDGKKYRLVRENRPVVLEKKQYFSHRMGDTARTEYKHSETEFSHKLRVYKETGFDEWEEITLDRLGL